jgi:hypothetical protein
MVRLRWGSRGGLMQGGRNRAPAARLFGAPAGSPRRGKPAKGERRGGPDRGASTKNSRKPISARMAILPELVPVTKATPMLGRGRFMRESPDTHGRLQGDNFGLHRTSLHNHACRQPEAGALFSGGTSQAVGQGKVLRKICAGARRWLSKSCAEGRRIVGK